MRVKFVCVSAVGARATRGRAAGQTRGRGEEEDGRGSESTTGRRATQTSRRGGAGAQKTGQETVHIWLVWSR